MARLVFRRASSGTRTVRGELVKKVQRALEAGGLSPGGVDGVYGDATERALIAYQTREGLAPTGQVDSDSWTQLTRAPIPSVQERCLQLTADFEGTGFTKALGNFDGAGITWGIIGFTLKHGELRKILAEIGNRDPALLDRAFGPLRAELEGILRKGLEEQMRWADGITVGRQRTRLEDEWAEAFERLGEMPLVQEIQLAHTQWYWERALRDAKRFELKAELGVSLCFDIAVQNGGVDSAEAARIQAKRQQLSPTTEQEIRVIIANVVAENSNPRWVENVRARKLAMATGQGTVHGARYEVRTWGLDEIPA